MRHDCGWSNVERYAVITNAIYSSTRADPRASSASRWRHVGRRPMLPLLLGAAAAATSILVWSSRRSFVLLVLFCLDDVISLSAVAAWGVVVRDSSTDQVAEFTAANTAPTRDRWMFGWSERRGWWLFGLQRPQIDAPLDDNDAFFRRRVISTKLLRRSSGRVSTECHPSRRAPITVLCVWSAGRWRRWNVAIAGGHR
jgi:hypothetical protein